MYVSATWARISANINPFHKSGIKMKRKEGVIDEDDLP